MKNTYLICRKEVRSYFVSPIAYAVLALFAFLFGGLAFFPAVRELVRYGMQAQMQGQPISLNDQIIRPLLGFASTISIAPTGHSSAHKLCPMHLCALIIAALPSTTPSTSPSGQAATQAPHPMQESVWMRGCCARGPSEKRGPLDAAWRMVASRAL